MTKISNGRLANTKKEIEMITNEEKKQLIHPGCIVIASMYDPFTKSMMTHPYYVWRYNGSKKQHVQQLLCVQDHKQAKP